VGGSRGIKRPGCVIARGSTKRNTRALQAWKEELNRYMGDGKKEKVLHVVLIGKAGVSR